MAEGIQSVPERMYMNDRSYTSNYSEENWFYIYQKNMLYYKKIIRIRDFCGNRQRILIVPQQENGGIRDVS